MNFPIIQYMQVSKKHLTKKPQLKSIMRKDIILCGFFFKYYFLNFKKCNILQRGPVDFYEPPNMYTYLLQLPIIYDLIYLFTKKH